VTLNSSQNPVQAFQAVTFFAQVSSPNGTPNGGTVTFFDAGVAIGSGPVQNGLATLTTSALSIGKHTITASYGGNGNFAASAISNTVNQTVGTSNQLYVNLLEQQLLGRGSTQGDLVFASQLDAVPAGQDPTAARM